MKTIRQISKATEMHFKKCSLPSKVNELLFLFLVEEASKHTNLVNLAPKQVRNFDIQFNPITEGEFNCMVKLHVINNPFELFKVLLKTKTIYLK